MAGGFTAIDLSQLPKPDVVEQIDYETILSSMIEDLQARDDSFDALVESDPAYKILEVCAYREVLIRQRVNDASHANMLAYAGGADLDQIAANYNVERLVLDEGDPDATPPVPPAYESDDDLRQRVQLSFEGFSTAGSEGAYIFHALSADADVLDATVSSPTPGRVVVTVLSRQGDGEPDSALLDAVKETLVADDVRPLSDTVTVQAATIRSYTVEAELTVYPGPDPDVVKQSAEKTLEEYTKKNHKLGHDITVSGLYAALHRSGVQNVRLKSPLSNLVVSSSEAAFCLSYNVTVVGIDE